MITLVDLASFLDHYFAVERYGPERGGIVQQSDQIVRRLGLALEPGPQLARWVQHQRLDALFLHRHWALDEWPLDPTLGIIAYHLPFDERLTLGFNIRLADLLHLFDLAVLGEKEGRAIGMIGSTVAAPFDAYVEAMTAIFGGYEELRATAAPVDQIAVVGAMTDALVREAAQRGAQLYVTGQFRQPARAAVDDTGIGVISVGHRRSEVWGLRALAGVLRERWARLEVVSNK